jgi:hypothetical protein
VRRVSKSLPYFKDLNGESVVRDKNTRPKSLKEFVAGNDFTSVLSQINKYIDRLWRKRQTFVAIP